MFDPIILFNDTVKIRIPQIIDGKLIKDKYGRSLRETREVPAHVRYSMTNYYTSDGEGRTSDAQVYIPDEEITRLIDYETRIIHTNPSGDEQTRAIQKIEYGQDVTGANVFIKVYL